MRRSTNQNVVSPSKKTAHLMSTMTSATENNARVRSNNQSMMDKVESARRHLKNHQKQFHTGEDSSSGESVENRSPHHHIRSRSSPRNAESDLKVRSRDKPTPSVLYSAELQHARRMSGEARKRSSSVKKTTTSRFSSAKSISPARHNSSFHNQSMLDSTLTTSPGHRNTFVVGPGHRNTFVVGGQRETSFRGDATFAANRRDTFTIDRRDETTVSHDETVIAPGLLEEEYRPRRQRAHSHGSKSAFHARCTPKDPHPHEVSNVGKWEVEFLPGSLSNARKIEKDRRSAAYDLVSPNAEALRYQEERTRREEEELKRLVREQMNGRSTKEIFDNWVPLDEERRTRKEGQRETVKKSTQRLWEEKETDEGGEMMSILDRRGREDERREDMRVVMEDEAGYAMPLTKDVVNRPPLRTPSPLSPLHRGSSPDEQFFTPVTTAPRLSRVSGLTEKKADGETPILGRQSTRFSTTFTMDRTRILDRSVHRLRGGADEADRSVGSSFQASPDRRDESSEGRDRSMGEYATPVGRRGGGGEGRRRDDEENSFLNASSHDQSRGVLNESMNAFERSLNRSLDHLSSLASRLSSQLETSKANLSAMAAPTDGIPPRERGIGLEGVAGDRRLGMEASILESLPPMRDERNSVGGNELRRLMAQSSERDHRSSLPDETKREEERVERLMSPIPRPRTTVLSYSPSHPLLSSAPHSSVHDLASLLDANIGRMERSEVYEREAQRLEGVVREINQTASKVENAVKERPVPPRPSSLSSIPPTPSPRLSVPLPRPRSASIESAAGAAAPRPQLAIDTAGGRAELVEMYESRHRNWHRRGDDLPVPSPRSSMSRSPSPVPFAYANPAELRERQSVQGMLDQRSKAVRGAFLHLLQKMYRARFERRYEEKKRFHGDVEKQREFAEEQKREEDAFRREANEAKKKAIDTSIRYRDFMQWLKEESERMEKEIKCEVERRERIRWKRKMEDEGVDQSLLDSSRWTEANRLLDERARKAMQARQKAHKHMEKREEVRRLESEAKRAVALAEIPSSARSSIDDASFLLNRSRRYSIGNEPLRVGSGRGGSVVETSMNGSRDGKSRDESRLGDVSSGARSSTKEEMNEMKERLEEKRRQAEGVRRAMEESEKRMNETELISVAAQLAAHDDYIRGVERVGRVIAENVQPRSPSALPPGVEPLDLSSLDEERKEGEEEKKSGDDSLEKSTDMSGKMNVPRSILSRDSLDGFPSSVPSTEPSTRNSRKSSSSSTSSSSSNKTLRPPEAHSPLLEEITVVVEEKWKESIYQEKSTVSGEKREDTIDRPQFSPLSEGRNDELDRSLPSTAPSTGRQELPLDTVLPIHTVSIPETSVPEDTVPNWARVRDPSVPASPVHSVDAAKDASEQESIPEEIEDDTVARSTVPSRTLFSPIESSTSGNAESESSADKECTVAEVKSTVVEKKESIEEKSESSEEKEEEEALDVSTASLKKAISVASEMANPFDGFESSSGGSRKREEEEEEEDEEEMVQSAADATATPAASLDGVTVVEKSMIREREEEDEISWGDGGALEVGGGSARSEDFDWGVSPDEKRGSEILKEEETTLENHHQLDIQKEEETRPIGKLASLKDRLNKICVDEEDEKGSGKPSSSSSSSASSSASSSTPSSSSSATTSTEKSTSGRTEGTSAQSSERKDEKGEEEEETTPRVPSVSGGLSSASGSIDFDADVNLPAEVPSSSSSRTPRAVSKSRFRLSLDDSFPDSPRDTTTHKSSSSSTALLNGRFIGVGSPRAATPTSPHTPRAMMHPSLISPSAAASPEGRRSRFSAVMPLSPRSGRISTSPKNTSYSLSREVSIALDDSSFGDLSRLSAVELPSNNGGMSGFPPILSSLPPLVSPSLLPPIRHSIGQSLNGSSIEEGEEMDESLYDLMDIKTPVSGVLSSLPIGELIGDKNEKEEEEEEEENRSMVSPPLTLTARSNGSLHEQCQAITKNEFTIPRIEREVDRIWKVIEKKGFFAKEDVEGLVEMDLEKEENDEVSTLMNERIRLIHSVSCEIASTLYARDERRTKDGRTILKEIVPLRRLLPSISKEQLKNEIEKQLLITQSRQVPSHANRMKNLGVDFFTLPIEERIIYNELYGKEENLVHSDLERREIMDVLMGL